ncbi:MAG: ATP-binding protein [Syntrophales bacterium]|jgi:PAS domain S-box-containing protein
MEIMHSLLKRQIKRHLGELDAIPKEWEALINAVNEAYRQMDMDREMLERSLELSSDELLEANAEMRELNRTLKMISECNQIVVRAKDEMSLLQDICRIIVDIGGYLTAWVGFAEQDEGKSVRPVAFAGHDDGCLKAVNISWADNESGRGAAGIAIRTGKPAFAENVSAYPTNGPWYIEARKSNCRSSVAIPLIADGHAFGALNICGSKPGKFKPEEVKLLTEMADDLSYGMVLLRTREERKRSEAALRESEGKYRYITERMSDVIWTMDSNLGVQYVSPSVSKALGFTPEERMKHTLFERITPESIEKAEEVLKFEMQRDRESGVDPNRTATLELEYYHKNGSTVWHETVISGIRDVKGNIIGYHGASRDITERKNIEKERKGLEERLQRAEKMEALGTLAGGVAHDLNNVLGIVVGYAEKLLMDADASSPIREDLQNIMSGGQRAAAIVQDLLTLARRGVSNRKVLNLNRIIADCPQSPEFQKLFSYHPFVRIEADLEPDLLNISGSSVHLGKTLFNLVSNASEAMPKGGILTIKTANQYLDRPIQGYDEVREGDYVVLYVSDTGEGIPAADLKRIFEPFYTKKVMGRSGTGLGLAVVWGTVKDHNGYINVESEEGKGSTFTLYFPVTREDMSTEAVAISMSEYMGKGESILVVDDVKEQRDLAEDVLRKLNYNAASVSSGEEAISYLKEHKIDLMVLDMIMDPGMDGLDTYRSVLEIHPQQKAIIVSGFSETDRVHAAQSLGAGAYVRKPYVMEKLGLAVKKELDRR